MGLFDEEAEEEAEMSTSIALVDVSSISWPRPCMPGRSVQLFGRDTRHAFEEGQMHRLQHEHLGTFPLCV